MCRPPVPKNRLRPSHQIIAGIAQTHKPVMIEIHKQFGGTLHGYDHFRRKHANNRTMYRWHVSSQKAARFLQMILPCLIVKREQAGLCLQLSEHINQHRVAMIGDCATIAFREGVLAYRYALAYKIAALNKVNYNISVDDGAKPYRPYLGGLG